MAPQTPDPQTLKPSNLQTDRQATDWSFNYSSDVTPLVSAISPQRSAAMSRGPGRSGEVVGGGGGKRRCGFQVKGCQVSVLG